MSWSIYFSACRGSVRRAAQIGAATGYPLGREGFHDTLVNF
jgi:hypothetical protein